MRFTRAMYIPKDPTAVIEKNGGIVYFVSQSASKCAMGFSGKRARPDFNFKFENEEKRADYVSRYFERLAEIVSHRTERKIERSGQTATFVAKLEPGVILYDTWGYDQTNVEFYVVVERVGAKVLIQELSHVTIEGSQGHDCDRVVPGVALDKKPIWVNVRGPRIKIESCISLGLYVPSESGVYRSWYA